MLTHVRMRGTRQVRDAMGPDKFSKMFEDCDDPLSAMKIEIDPRQSSPTNARR